MIYRVLVQCYDGEPSRSDWIGISLAIFYQHYRFTTRIYCRSTLFRNRILYI